MTIIPIKKHYSYYHYFIQSKFKPIIYPLRFNYFKLEFPMEQPPQTILNSHQNKYSLSIPNSKIEFL